MHLFQVGAGSGGMPVLDLVSRDPRVTHVTLVEPDVYKPHNVERHQFPPAAVGRLKADLAAEWVKSIRPEISVAIMAIDLLDPARQDAIESAVAKCDFAICAVDNEPAKYHFDTIMRKKRKPWTLGEVLSGGIGGFVHCFVPGGPCYGCVASFLKRDVTVEKPIAPDYSQPGAAVPEATIPARKSAIAVIAAIHAEASLQMLDTPPMFTTLLMPLRAVPDVFPEAFRPHRFRVARSADCLICRPPQVEMASEDLDVALAEALARLDHE